MLVYAVTLSFIYSFFINLDSLEVIRLINDQTCPYFKYRPIEERSSLIHEIIVDDRPPDQRTSYMYADIGSDYHWLFYAFKPYE